MNRVDIDEKLLIVGASGHGLVARDAAEAQGYQFVGYLDSFKPVGRDGVIGHPKDLRAIAKSIGARYVFVAISNNWIRYQFTKKLRLVNKSLELASVIHPSAVIAPGALIGIGSLVCAGAIINSGCRISHGCIINTKASIDHGCRMKQFSSLLPGSTVCGDCCIGVCACVCAGVCVSHGVTIGDHALIGAGSLILRDVENYSIAFGSPAKSIGKRKKDTKHF